MELTEESGVSICMSSLTPEELPLGAIYGGGVWVRSSAKFHIPKLVELRAAWNENVLDERRLAADMFSLMAIETSSGVSPEPLLQLSFVPALIMGRRLGDEVVVVGCEIGVLQILSEAALALSLSRTWRITSASRDTSVSIGAASSRRAARIRWRFLGLG